MTITYELEATVPDRLSIRIQERFGDQGARMISRAVETLYRAEEEHGFSTRGFVSSSGRSLVAEVETHGMSGICKVPLVDCESVIEAILNSAEDGSGPDIIDSGDRFVIMSKLVGTTPQIDTDLIHWTILAAERRTIQRNASPMTRTISMALSESARRASRSAHTDSYANMASLGNWIIDHQESLRSFQCHGDSSVRNMIDTGGRLYFIDPEPTIAPVEYDVSKLLTFGNPLDIERLESGDISISEVAHERLAPVEDDLRRDASLSYEMLEKMTEFFLIMRGLSNYSFSAFERNLNW